GVSVEDDLVELARDSREEPITQRPQAGVLGLALAHQDFARLGEADDAGHVQRARAAAALVATAIHLRDEPYARLRAAHVERADALRAINFVRGDRRQVHVHGLDVEGRLADALHGVAVEQHRARARDLSDFGDG